MDEKKDEYKKPPNYCPDCGKEVETTIEVKPLKFDEWLNENRKKLGTSYNINQLQIVWDAAREQLILSCYKTLTDDEEDGSGYLRDEILSHVTKMVKGEKTK